MPDISLMQAIQNCGTSSRSLFEVLLKEYIVKIDEVLFGHILPAFWTWHPRFSKHQNIVAAPITCRDVTQHFLSRGQKYHGISSATSVQQLDEVKHLRAAWCWWFLLFCSLSIFVPNVVFLLPIDSFESVKLSATQRRKNAIEWTTSSAGGNKWKSIHKQTSISIMYTPVN